MSNEHKGAGQRARVIASRRKFVRAGAAFGGLALFGGHAIRAAAQKMTDLPMVNGMRELGRTRKSASLF